MTFKPLRAEYDSDTCVGTTHDGPDHQTGADAIWPHGATTVRFHSSSSTASVLPLGTSPEYDTCSIDSRTL